MRFTKKDFAVAFKYTIPIMTAYLFLGLAFGLVLNQAGFSWVWALFMSFYVYAGSMQFVLIPLMAQGAPLAEVAILTLMVNSRHLFYGLSFIEDFNSMGKLKPYMVHTLTDETYSVLTALEGQEGRDRRAVMFLISLFDHAYWIIGSLAGTLLGKVMPWDLSGIDFSMTALFTVVFTEQWLRAKNHVPAVIGVASSVFYLILVGPGNFMLPALITTVGLLIIAQRRGIVHG